MHTLQWFKNRIGRRIFRNDNKCPCNNCKVMTKEGLIVHDLYHAEGLFMIQNDYMAEGTKLNYRDKL